MKHPFYKSLVAAGALATVGALVACGDDSGSNNPGAVPSDICTGVIATEQVSVVEMAGIKLVVYPIGIEGFGKVTLSDGSVYGSYDGAYIYNVDGEVVMAAGYADLQNQCPASAVIDPNSGEVIPNSSAASEDEPIVGPGGIQSSASMDEPIVGPGGIQSSASMDEPLDGPGGIQSSSSEVVQVTPSGNPEEDIKKYPVPTLKTILGNGSNGWNTRYWDACKPHCSWAEAGKDDRPDITSQAAYEKTLTSARNCNINDVEVPTFTYSKGLERYWIGYEGTPSACEIGEGGVFTCTDMAPVAVNDTLAYAFVAGNPSITTCGKCFHLQYDGSFADASENNKPKETHKALKGKHIIVMASNIGHDVKVGQFDLMVPGGGPGIFNALNLMVNRSDIEWGAQYGGFLTYCQQQLGYDKGLKDYQTCIKDMCDAAFADAGRPNLLRGCHWFADWFMAADNPTYQYEEIECPQYLVDKYMTTISTTIDTEVLYQADWSSYKGGDLITTEACSPTPNATGEYCDPAQLDADKAKKY